MTPDKRLNQLEPVVADVLQKVDRLIEGQGQLVDLATGTHKLATDTHKLATDTHELATGTYELATTTHELAVRTHDLATNTKTELQQVKSMGEITANGLAKLTLVVADLRDEMRERFDKNEQTQQEILMLLRERLK